MTDQALIPIRSDADIVTARQHGRALAAQLGFPTSDQVLIATVVSELARNIVEYAGQGEIALTLVQRGSQDGVKVVARDHGPGIADIEQAMQDGYSTSKSLGLGLPGSRRMMDEFEIVSKVGKGTTVTATKWMR